MREAGGRVDFASEHDERAMTVLGLSSKREVTRTRIRVRTAMAAQPREGRYMGGRPPYGYRLADAGPHPEQGARPLGPAGAPPEARPGRCACGALDVRPAAGREFRGADHPGAERCRH